MSSKVDRAIHGPSWAEVIIGAVLSLVLGIFVGAAVLVVKPVVVVKELPKDPAPGAVYYIEGSRDSSSPKDVLAKRKAFADGQSVQVTEGEINVLAAAATAPAAAAKPGAAPGSAAANEPLAAGTPNVRIHDGAMQIAVPVTVNVAGFTSKLLVQAQGGFEKEGSTFVYEPRELYLGSCPVQRFPFLSSYVRARLLASHPVPQDIATAWSKLSNVSIEGKTLTLTQ